MGVPTTGYSMNENIVVGTGCQPYMLYESTKLAPQYITCL